LGTNGRKRGNTMKKQAMTSSPKSALLFLLITAAFLGGCSGGKKGAGGFKPVVVVRDDLQITVLATGNVQPHNQLSIKPPISGRIEKLMINEGDYVKKGQVLAQLSSTERATLLDAARAQGPDVLAHWEQLYEATPLLSPENGQIVYLPTVPGQIVAQSDSIMTMSDHLIVNTQVDETDLAQIKMDQEAMITLDAYPSDPIEGKVQRISYQSTLVNNVTTYEVDVWPTKVPPFMRSGMTANVVFTVSEKDNILLIPSEAIQNQKGQQMVLKAGATPNDKPQTVTIQTGLTDGKQTEVVSGLAEGDKVLIKTFSAGQLSATSTGSNPFAPSRPTGGNKGGGGR
jgi:macrolide-specific efflux system membrane fusion protein